MVEDERLLAVLDELLVQNVGMSFISNVSK